MMHRVKAPLLALAGVALILASASPADAGSVSKSVPFQLDEWIELDATDGPVTLHRIRIREVGRMSPTTLRALKTSFMIGRCLVLIGLGIVVGFVLFPVIILGRPLTVPWHLLPQALVVAGALWLSVVLERWFVHEDDASDRSPTADGD